jgi:membrane-associated phospholipid phosphatase
MLLFFSFLAVSLIWAAGQRVDAAVFFFFNRRGKRPSWLDRTMRILTELGNSIATALIALLFYYDVSRTVAYAFVLGSLVLWLTVELMKILFGRQRPFAKLENVRVVGMRARGKSFPSGHTGQAFFTATLLSQYFCGQIPLCILIYFVALLVGITRMYMGMHYPRDVLAGATLGTFWGIIGTTVNSQILGLIGLT